MRSRLSPLLVGLLGVAMVLAPLGSARADTRAPAIRAAQAAPTIKAAEPAPETSPETGPENGYVDNRLLAIGAGAVVSIVAFNVLAAPLGTVPLAGGALEAVPYSVALGSRLIAAVSAGAGALSALWAYDAWNGTKSDYHYLVALGAGAIAGVGLGNYLALGELGLAALLRRRGRGSRRGDRLHGGAGGEPDLRYRHGRARRLGGGLHLSPLTGCRTDETRPGAARPRAIAFGARPG